MDKETVSSKEENTRGSAGGGARADEEERRKPTMPIPDAQGGVATSGRGYDRE